MRGALFLAVAAGLALGGGLLSPDAGSGASERARARALIAGGSIGPQIEASSFGTQTQRRTGEVFAPGVEISSGEANARSSLDGTQPQARATAAARSVSLLDGLVTAYGVRRTVEETGARRSVSGRVDGLRIGDELIGDVDVPRRFALPEHAGRVVVNTGTIGLRVELDKPYAGQPAGTDLRIAIADAGVALPAPAATPEPSPEATAEPAKRKRTKKEAAKKLERRAAPELRRRLTAGGFAFPVYGAAATADDFGGPRQIGPHQGNDIFADFGAPVVAVADGRVSKVGTLPISGNRLWLTTASGDAFFYAHLSAFSEHAVSGARVKAGTVLGFVGNTGDAEPTPPHVHFEIHPGGMDEDAIDPHSILLAWQGQRDVPPGAWLQRYGPDTAERPGALVAVRDFIAE